MALFVVMTVVGLVFGIYFIFLQYFVLLVEVILFAILLTVEGLELIIGFFACWQFQSYEKQQWSIIFSHVIKLDGHL